VSFLEGLVRRVVSARRFRWLYSADSRDERVETECFRTFTYDELLARDKPLLDIVRLRDESLEDNHRASVKLTLVVLLGLVGDTKVPFAVSLTRLWCCSKRLPAVVSRIFSCAGPAVVTVRCPYATTMG
jgi:hypothetical protein